ncbi:hypothetical protein B7494_g6667 [Chlorociboria aeruginascens]|nr:hypothetical protein B7494_g6667 [Chlorociboria aeruginascens]
MTYRGFDLTAKEGEGSATISWHHPHPIFVIILVGEEEIPYGIQKDLLCAQSPYYREEFSKPSLENKVEHVVKLPNTDVETFGCFQSFVYTGEVYNKRGGEIPDYPLLLSVWKLANKLRMAPLRIAVLDAMVERRQKTSLIPDTPLLIQAWKETDEGSGLRLMLVGWAAEHMRSSPVLRSQFAKSLPQEILSELVIVMSGLPETPAAPVPSRTPKRPLNNAIDLEQEQSRPNKRARKSDTGVIHVEDTFDVKPNAKKPPRHSSPVRRINRRALNFPSAEIVPLTPEKELGFSRDLIGRMLSGPGFWTRLVGPFKNPVDPVIDNVPNYFDVVKRPMDLRTIQTKMSKGEYTTAVEFEADVRLIFQNCYEYWTQDDPIFKLCEQLEKYFNEKWGARHKWVPSVKAEVIN